MKLSLIFPIYLIWHYSTAFSDIRRLYKNAVWFMYHFFSIELLLKTLFSPFRRLSGVESESKDEGFLSKIIVNLMMRIVGFFTRGLVISVGFLFIALTNIFFLILIVFWLFLPILIPAFFLLGFGFLI